MIAHRDATIAFHSLDLLAPHERREVDEHICECSSCRWQALEYKEVRDGLDRLPPEMFLDGPPEAELVLRRTLRRVRGESLGHGGRRAAFAAAVLAVATVAGISGFIARDAGQQAAPAAAPPAADALVTKTFSGSNEASGVSMQVTVTPQPGWMEVKARFVGVRSGERCRLVVDGRDGSSTTVLSWIAPASQPATGVVLGGAVLVAPDAVAGFEVDTTDGRKLVTTA
jgi:hypothetical protein